MRYGIVVFFLFLIFPLSLSAEHFTLKPPATRLVEQTKENPGEGLVIFHYKYESMSSPDEIIEFYRQLFSNRGYQEIGLEQDKRKQQRTFFFKKEKEGTMVILNFLRLIKGGMVTYYLTIHEFDLSGVRGNK